MTAGAGVALPQLGAGGAWAGRGPAVSSRPAATVRPVGASPPRRGVRAGRADDGSARQLDLETVQRAALLSKSDLATEMIRDGKEFTKLQGIIGPDHKIRRFAGLEAAK